MIRPEQIIVDRFPVANAEFWLSMTALWLAEPGNAEQFATDLWGRPDTITGTPVLEIVTDAAARLRAVLSDPDPDTDTDGSSQSW